VTIQRVVRKLDAGPVLARRATPIEPDDDRGTLSERLARLGGDLLIEVVEAFAAGRPPPEEPQDEAAVTVCRRLRREDAEIDWTLDAAHLGRMVRAYRPRPGARTVLLREPELPLEVRRAEAAEGPGEPGVVAHVAPEHFEVGTGAGRLRILEVVPAARKPMSARAFLNGYRLTTGERFR
jgi:methionyl-tRNA formyltransferase